MRITNVYKSVSNGMHVLLLIDELWYYSIMKYSRHMTNASKQRNKILSLPVTFFLIVICAFFCNGVLLS